MVHRQRLQPQPTAKHRVDVVHPRRELQQREAVGTHQGDQAAAPTAPRPTVSVVVPLRSGNDTGGQPGDAAHRAEQAESTALLASAAVILWESDTGGLLPSESSTELQSGDAHRGEQAESTVGLTASVTAALSEKADTGFRSRGGSRRVVPAVAGARDSRRQHHPHLPAPIRPPVAGITPPLAGLVAGIATRSVRGILAFRGRGVRETIGIRRGRGLLLLCRCRRGIEGRSFPRRKSWRGKLIHRAVYEYLHYCSKQAATATRVKSYRYIV